MKKHLFIIIAAIIISTLLFSGCEELQQQAVVTQIDDIASQSSVPAPVSIPKPTAAPTPTPISVATPTTAPSPITADLDITVHESFNIDLDDDGVDEIVTVSSKPSDRDEIMLSVDGTEYHNLFIAFGYFESVHFIDNNYILISCDDASEDYFTEVYSFNNTEPVFLDEIWGYVAKIDDTTITTIGHIYVFGTWNIYVKYVISENQVSELEGDKLFVGDHDYKPLITAIELPVQILSNEIYKDAKLAAGKKIYLTATDEKSYVLFRLEDGTEGKLIFDVDDDWNTSINGIDEFDCFVDLDSYYWD